EMLHRDRQVGELGMMIEGDDGQSRGRKHHGVAGLADGLAAGEQQEIATGAPVQLQFRISFRLESGLGIQRIHYLFLPNWSRDAARCRGAQRRLTLSRKNGCRSSQKENTFAAWALRGGHNSLAGVDGLIKSRKFTIDVQAGAPA